MKGYKQIFIVLSIGVFILPQITLAAWWNPFTWPIFNKPQISTVSTPVQKTQNPNAISTSGATQTKAQARINGLSVSNVAKKQEENKIQLVQLSQKLSNKKIITKVKPAVVYIETDTELGSGFIIESNGYILTNAHVVAGTNTVGVTLSTGIKYTGMVVGRDENIDIALIKINATGLPVETLGDSDQLEQGDNIFTFGYPLGIEGDVSFKDGTVSRHLTSNGITYIEISAQILPGNSGGPLVDETGNVVGINTFARGQGKIEDVLVGETLKFAMPINVAKSLLSSLKAGRNILLPHTVAPSTVKTAPVLPPQTYVPPPQTYVPPPPPAAYVPPAKPTPRFIGEVQFVSSNSFTVRFENAPYAGLKCGNTWYSKSLSSGSTATANVGPGATCTYYLNLNPAPVSGSGSYPYYDGSTYIWVSNASTDLIEAKDLNGNPITKSFTTSLSDVIPQNPPAESTPSTPITPAVSVQAKTINLIVEGHSFLPFLEFQIFKKDSAGQPLSVKKVVLIQTGSITNADFESVSYLGNINNTFVNTPIINNRIEINYNANHGNRILIKPKIKSSGFGKTFKLSVESIQVELEQGEVQGSITGSSVSPEYQVPDQAVPINGITWYSSE